MSNARRRRYECTNCGERQTMYEVTDAFYNQSIANERVLHELKLYIDKKSGLVNKHVKDCSTCEYNEGSACNLGVPEFDTEEATKVVLTIRSRNGRLPLGRLNRISNSTCRRMLGHRLHPENG